MRLCTRCVLPETFPGIQFDDEGVCQFCRRMPTTERRAEQKASLRARFEQLVDEVRAESGYHCLMSWSGGKDSTYTLWLLSHEYGLRVLAFTFDNGFVSPQAMNNMRTVADNLGVDHVITRPGFPLLRQLFVASTEPGMYSPQALERASGVCSTCMGLAKGLCLRLALEKDIPIMAYGWSPGQIPLASAVLRQNAKMVQAMVEAAAAPLQAASGGRAAVYFPEARHFQQASRMPVNVSPLIFLDWSEDAAVRVVESYGWRRPDDTDPNSTNCLLNAYANHMHMQQMSYHPYAMELAGLVREGYMSREEALARLAVPPAAEIVATVAERLGVPEAALE
ncbi:MAG: hypothetical protein GX601_10690 [Anaerolineales bacterium]|nr:hypothetical protein [Anaerolineales bacterium]